MVDANWCMFVFFSSEIVGDDGDAAAAVVVLGEDGKWFRFRGSSSPIWCAEVMLLARLQERWLRENLWWP